VLIVRIVLLCIPRAPRTHQEERTDSSDYIITTNRTSARNLTVIPKYLTTNRVIHLFPTVLSFILLYTTASSTQRVHGEMYSRSRSDYFVDLGLETFHSDRHLRGIEGVLHHCICICFVNFLQRCVRAGVRYGSDKDKLGSCSQSMLGAWQRNDGDRLTRCRKVYVHLECLCLDDLHT